MFGTILTLHGTQCGDVFVADNNVTYILFNSWVIKTMCLEKYICIQKYDDNQWRVLRSITV